MNIKETVSHGTRSNGFSFRKAAVRSKIAEIIPADIYTITLARIAVNRKKINIKNQFLIKKQNISSVMT